MKRSLDDDDTDDDDGQHPPKRQRPPLASLPSPPPADVTADDRVAAWLRSVSVPTSISVSAAVAAVAAVAAASPPPSDERSAAVASMPPPSSTHSSRAGSDRGSQKSSRLAPRDYRTQVVRPAGIDIDPILSDDDRLRRQPPPLQPSHAELIAEVGRKLYSDARAAFEPGTAAEVDWEELLYHALDDLAKRLGTGRFHCVRGRDWLATLKPVAYTRKWSVSMLPKRPPPDTAMAPPSAAPVIEPASARLQPRTPRPDVTLGFDSYHLQARLQQPGLLDELQRQTLDNDEGARALLSDPCTTSPSGLRFPFFVAELKSAAQPMIEAENQAAVSGASLQNMLRCLAPFAPDGVEFPRTFSLTTEAQYCVLWCHYSTPPDPSALVPSQPGTAMAFLDHYRITDPRGARDLIDALARILTWGSTQFESWLIHSVRAFVGLPPPDISDVPS